MEDGKADRCAVHTACILRSEVSNWWVTIVGMILGNSARAKRAVFCERSEPSCECLRSKHFQLVIYNIIPL